MRRRVHTELLPTKDVTSEGQGRRWRLPLPFYWLSGILFLFLPLFVLWRLPQNLPKGTSSDTKFSLSRMTSQYRALNSKLFSQAFRSDCGCPGPSPDGLHTMKSCCIGGVYTKLESHLTNALAASGSSCVYARNNLLVIPGKGKKGRHSFTSGPFHLGGARSISLAIRVASSGHSPGEWTIGLLTDPDPTCGRSCSVTLSPGVPGVRIFGHEQGIKDANGAPLAYPYHPEMKVQR